LINTVSDRGKRSPEYSSLTYDGNHVVYAPQYIYNNKKDRYMDNVEMRISIPINQKPRDGIFKVTSKNNIPVPSFGPSIPRDLYFSILHYFSLSSLYTLALINKSFHAYIPLYIDREIKKKILTSVAPAIDSEKKAPYYSYILKFSDNSIYILQQERTRISVYKSNLDCALHNFYLNTLYYSDKKDETLPLSINQESHNWWKVIQLASRANQIFVEVVGATFGIHCETGEAIPYKIKLLPPFLLNFEPSSNPKLAALLEKDMCVQTSNCTILYNLRKNQSSEIYKKGITYLFAADSLTEKISLAFAMVLLYRAGNISLCNLQCKKLINAYSKCLWQKGEIYNDSLKKIFVDARGKLRLLQNISQNDFGSEATIERTYTKNIKNQRYRQEVFSDNFLDNIAHESENEIKTAVHTHIIQKMNAHAKDIFVDNANGFVCQIQRNKPDGYDTVKLYTLPEDTDYIVPWKPVHTFLLSPQGGTCIRYTHNQDKYTILIKHTDASITKLTYSKNESTQTACVIDNQKKYITKKFYKNWLSTIYLAYNKTASMIARLKSTNFLNYIHRFCNYVPTFLLDCFNYK
jgi:hypothetical protein